MARYENGLLVAHRALGHSQVTVGATAVGLPNIPTGDIRRIVIRPIDGDICWRDDDVDPTSTTGFLTYADEVVVFDGLNPTHIKLIRAASALSDADVRIVYYGA